MALITLPGEGIELPLSEYNRLRAFQGGGWFWDHENQQVIREVLGDFLPRVEERPAGSRGGAVAFFQHFSGGAEAAGKSEAVGAQMNRVPRPEYERLQRALEALKRKAENPHTDPNARRVIEKFCLPDPALNPELYRLHGSGWNRRLLVLWGCEREGGTSLAPATALQKLNLEPPTAAFLRRLPLAFGLLLLLGLLALAAYHFWPHREDGLAREGSALARQDPPLPLPAAPDTVSSANPALPAVANPPSSPTPSPQDANSGAAPLPGGASPAPSSSTTRTDTRQNDSSTTNSAPTAASPVPPASAHHPTPSVPGRLATPARPATPGLAPTPANPGLPSLSPAGDLATPALSSADRRTESTTTRDTRASSASSRQTGTSPSPSIPATGNPPGLSPATGGTPGLSPATGSTRPPPGASPTLDNRLAAATSPPPGDLAPTNGGTPPAADGNAPASTLPAPRLEILNAPTSTPPHDGKLDLVLMATARETDGALATVAVTRWSVDGTRQQDRAGHDVTASQISLTLPPGKHRVSAIGTARGLPVETEAEVNVQIKSEGDVTVKSSPK